METIRTGGIVMASFFRSGKPQLFSREIEPSCSYCEYGIKTQDGGAILCTRCGVVAPDYSCRKFRYDPISREVRPRVLTGHYQKEDFEL